MVKGRTVIRLNCETHYSVIQSALVHKRKLTIIRGDFRAVIFYEVIWQYCFELVWAWQLFQFRNSMRYKFQTARPFL